LRCQWQVVDIWDIRVQPRGGKLKTIIGETGRKQYLAKAAVFASFVVSQAAL
jgi:hypothetical protein